MRRREEVTEQNPAAVDEIERLAEALYWRMDRMEPSEDGKTWDQLTDDNRYFYRECVREIFRLTRPAPYLP